MIPDKCNCRIVVLGGGFAGAYCARGLEKKLGSRVTLDLGVIDRNNYFVFYPLLVEALTGNIEPRHVVVPIRSFLKSSRFIRGEITGLNTRTQRVFYRVSGLDREENAEYDHLVVALGSITRMPNIPGLQQWGLQLKTLSDAIALRDRVIHLLESADAAIVPEERRSLLRFVIVGANFTGVELAGELQQFLIDACKFYRNVSLGDCRITLVETADRILPALDADLASYAAQHLQRTGVEILLRNSVRAVEEDGVTTIRGIDIPARTVVWAAGVAPSPLIGRLGLPTDERGYILCERNLRVKGFENVWAIGDCAVNVGPDGKPYPATAQHALREGQDLARNLSDLFRGFPVRACDISSRGAMAALGGHRAVADVFGRRLTGSLAWFIRRSYYLFRIPGWSRKTRIAFDWTLNMLFARDIVQLGIQSMPPDKPLRRAA